MSLDLEAALVAVLKTECAQVHPVVAPFDTPLPYVTWQHIGGPTWRYTDNSAPGQRMAVVQVNVWAATVAGALTLMRGIEAALCAATAITARPESEPVSDHEPDLQRYGFLQDFALTGPR